MNFTLERLQKGETFETSANGNSMTPLIKSGETFTLSPATWEDVNTGNVVYCKVKGKFYTHLVKAVDPKRGCLIGNNHGRINGWTKKVYGKVSKG